ncbi:MEKHLA domain-containing protein [Methylomonas sp. SURF-2]|uniref:MEKHLA domain-containing protein n=1 Tax=Methylomonas subterranea TaxID=2952225 RepID=A0ABT1TD35_9GAMM|nr:MEKHLA domain-containing protein [Methylomonas sp. SURF-2]MCQ8103372.1 MEKHLA domain-containing protein [Methylomonas sp. SURF-2]
MQKIPAPAQGNHFYRDHVALLIDSYRQLLQRSFLHDIGEDCLGQRVFEAEFALLSHNTDPDPLFNYANLKALELFELSWDELIGMPSRLSVEPENQQARERLMAAVTDKGFVDNYTGIRVSKTGRRFRIDNVAIWNVHDRLGRYLGQAACFSDWTYL